ncbi:SRPBCC domain-containing protein [Singulisphaera sp. Ch08]|uniref:SRPBCC domain-containing protein n=1 Tax=Singulisphaera sp. Ch08 TaxID=3120278 RepID=A0AAU7CAI7_9BACT
MTTDGTRLATDPSEREVLITRVFDAPRELVFRAWTDPEHLTRWFAPTGCTTQFREFDLRPGGVFHSCVRSPEGHECWCKGVYREIAKPERIVYTVAISDANGNLVGPAEVGMDPDWPRETIVTVTFAELAGKTQLSLHQTVLESLAKRTGAHPSWLEMLDHLALDLANNVLL